MTSWMKERDKLVEQTLAFVKGVAAQRPIKTVAIEPVLAAKPHIPAIDAVAPDTIASVSDASESETLALPIAIPQTAHWDEVILAAESITVAEELPPTLIPQLPAMHRPAAKRPNAVVLPEREVIAQRVARFKAGQQKLLQDREDNYAAIQAKIRASLGNDPAI